MAASQDSWYISHDLKGLFFSHTQGTGFLPGPCKALAPILESVAPEYADRLTVMKINVVDHPESAKKYGVRGIPTLLIFKEGEVAGTKVGASSETDLKAFIESNI